MYEIRLTDGITGDHVRTYHSTPGDLRVNAIHAADDAIVRANHQSDDPLRPRADDIARNLHAGIDVRVWHHDSARPGHVSGCTDIAVVRVA